MLHVYDNEGERIVTLTDIDTKAELDERWEKKFPLGEKGHERFDHSDLISDIPFLGWPVGVDDDHLFPKGTPINEETIEASGLDHITRTCDQWIQELWDWADKVIKEAEHAELNEHKY